MTRTEIAELVDRQAPEALKVLDARSRRYLGMTGEEFIAAVRRGDELPTHPIVGQLLLSLGAPASPKS